MIPGSATPFLLAQSGEDSYKIDRSLRFNSGDSAYLSRTPSSAGNRKTWTWSGWVKIDGNFANRNLNYGGNIFFGTHDGQPTWISFNVTDPYLQFSFHDGTSYRHNRSQAEFRDPSAWYHVVVALDTTQSTGSERLKMYVNGTRLTDFSTSYTIPQDTQVGFNNTYQHNLGASSASTSGTAYDHFGGYLADVHFIDGQALAATNFGDFDDNNVWQPKKYSGTYGTNGFYLDFSNNSSNQALGYDATATTPTLNPRSGMDAVTYTGNGSTQSISSLVFKPDFVWIKNRGSAASHFLYDSVRGFSNGNAYELRSDGNNTEGVPGTATSGLTSFDGNGFTLGSDGGANANNGSFVAWAWKAGGSAVSNTDGTITSQVSANTDYGFSIVTWTAASNTTNSIGHGLNAAPKLILTKSRSNANNWRVYTATTGKDAYLGLNETGSATTYSNYWSTSEPTSSTFGVWNAAGGANNDGDMVAYCWSEVAGFSKFGSYAGSSSDVTITTGFKPRYILIKCTDATGQEWIIKDNVRGGDKYLEANNTNAEATGRNVTFNSDGFTLAHTQGPTNYTGRNYIYAAFADRPGNNWTPNNLIATAGFETANQGMDVVTWTGNGGSQIIGGTRWSDHISGTQFSSSYSKDKAFDGDLDERTFASVGTANLVFTPPSPITVNTSLRLRIKADSTGNSGALYVNGTDYSSSIQYNSNWLTIPNVSSLTSISFGKSTGNGHEMSSLAAIEIDGTILINGTGAGLNFKPDLIWTKTRSHAVDHKLVDSVRGITLVQEPNNARADYTDSNGITAINSDGFTLGNSGDFNTSGRTYIAWCWKAGGTAVSKTDGTIDSQVSVNNTYGFSIVSYTGNNTAGATIAHGLNSAPKFMIVKDRDSTSGWWAVYHVSQGNQKGGYLNDNQAFGNHTFWNNTTPTDTLFSVGANANTNANGNDFIAYCWSEIDGFSKFGEFSHSGSSSSVDLGFKPRFVMIKKWSASENWQIFDSSRTTNNAFFANLSNSENAGWAVTFSDSGFSWVGGSFTNGYYIYMAFADKPPGEIIDSLIDTPTNYTADSDNNGGNYATMNPLNKGSSQVTLSNGNLDVSVGTNSSAGTKCQSTIGMSSGKYYCEFTCVSGSHVPGLASTATNASGYFLGDDAGSWSYGATGLKYHNDPSATGASYGATWGVGDVIGVAFDADNGTLTFYKNGTSQGTAYTGLTSGPYFFATGGSNSSYNANFGQRPFAHTPPTGYVSLCTTNLSDPTIADGSKAFTVDLWSGDNTDPRTRTLSFGPDLVWIKTRNQTNWNYLTDSVRGAPNKLYSNSTSAEDTAPIYGQIDSFNSDGFTLGGGTDSSNPLSDSNQTGTNYVGWAWDAGTTTASNTDGSITSSVRANTSAGFSILTYTGTGASASVGHGLNSAPGFIIIKRRDGTPDWVNYHSALGVNKYLQLSLTDAATTSSGYWGTVNSSTFGLPSFSTPNASGGTFVAYCFAPVAGYSAFGSYTGNGSTDGPFLFTGFRPAFIMFKRTDSTGTWEMYDSARSPENPYKLALLANSNGAEYNVGAYPADMLSNGIKVRHTGAAVNANGGTYVYMAFAEHPFKTARAR